MHTRLGHVGGCEFVSELLASALPRPQLVGEAVKWGLRYRRMLVSPALELLKHRRRDLTLEGIRGCDERMMRHLHGSKNSVHGYGKARISSHMAR
jgi:hypothetical protein